MDLCGKCILITGAARGLGQRMAEVLAQQRANIAAAELDDKAVQVTVQLCAKKSGAEAKAYAVDVTDEAAVEALFSSVHKDFGNIDGVIGNAGITSDSLLVKAQNGKVITKMSIDDFHKVIAVDLRGVFLCGREAAVHMIESGRGGVIVNISSISRAGNIGQTNYSIARWVEAA